MGCGDQWAGHDDSGAVSIRTASLPAGLLARTNELEMIGVTGPGQFPPVVMLKEARLLGKGTTPPPRRVSYDELLMGRLPPGLSLCPARRNGGGNRGRVCARVPPARQQVCLRYLSLVGIHRKVLHCGLRPRRSCSCVPITNGCRKRPKPCASTSRKRTRKRERSVVSRIRWWIFTTAKLQHRVQTNLLAALNKTE